MNCIRLIVITSLIPLLVAVPAFARAVDGAAWRTMAEHLESGISVDTRLRDGKRFKATFISAQVDGVTIQRKTRVPVPVETIAYDSIASLSRVDASSMSAGKIAGIALGSAGAAIGTIFLILLASID